MIKYGSSGSKTQTYFAPSFDLVTGQYPNEQYWDDRWRVGAPGSNQEYRRDVIKVCDGAKFNQWEHTIIMVNVITLKGLNISVFRILLIISQYCVLLRFQSRLLIVTGTLVWNFYADYTVPHGYLWLVDSFNLLIPPYWQKWSAYLGTKNW